MANNNPFDWGSVFDEPEKEQAIPEPTTQAMPEFPGQASPKTPTYQQPAQPVQKPVDWGSALGDNPYDSHILKGGWELAKQLPSLVTDVIPLTAGRALRGGIGVTLDDQNWVDRWISENEKERERRKTLTAGEREMTWFKLPFTDQVVTLGDTEGAIDSIGYSTVNMIAMASARYAGAVAGGAVSGGNPVAAAAGGFAAGAAAGITVTGLATRDQFVADVKDMYLKKKGSSVITPEMRDEWDQLLSDIEGDATLYALWEAGPETFGNMFLAGVGKAGGGRITGALLDGLKVQIKNRISNEIGQAAAKVALSAGIGVTKLAAGLTEEALTETITTKKQGEIEFKNGTRDKAPTWEEAFKEVLPMVLITTPLLQVGIKGSQAINDKGIEILKGARKDADNTDPNAPVNVENRVDARKIMEAAGQRYIEGQQDQVQAMEIPQEGQIPVKTTSQVAQPLVPALDEGAITEISDIVSGASEDIDAPTVTALSLSERIRK